MSFCQLWVGPVPNRRPGGMVHPVKFIVEHVEAGTEPGSISWFQNPLAKVSAHFLIALDGTLHQAVDTYDVAWAEADFNPHARHLKFSPAVVRAWAKAHEDDWAEKPQDAS